MTQKDVNELAKRLEKLANYDLFICTNCYEIGELAYCDECEQEKEVVESLDYFTDQIYAIDFVTKNNVYTGAKVLVGYKPDIWIDTIDKSIYCGKYKAILSDNAIKELNEVFSTIFYC